MGMIRDLSSRRARRSQGNTTASGGTERRQKKTRRDRGWADHRNGEHLRTPRRN